MSSKRKRKSKNQKQNGLQFQQLEQKQLLASISLQNGVLILDGSNGRDVARIAQPNSNTVRAQLTGVGTRTFNASQVNEIKFFAKNGNDIYMNNTDIPSRAFGQGGNDRLTGGTNQDILWGGQGADTINGGDGRDVLRGESGNDMIRGGNQNDRIEGQNGNDRLYGENGSDTILGGNGADRIMGGASADILRGGSGNDRVDGQAGNDTVQGDAGYDTLIGGADQDRAIYGSNFGTYNIRGGGQDVEFFDSVSREIVSQFELVRFADGTRSTNNLGGGGNGGGGNGGGNNGGGGDNSVSGRNESFRLLNNFRNNNSFGNLTLDAELNTFAANWSAEMGRTGFRHSTDAARNALLRSGETSQAENIAFATNNGQTAAEIAQVFHNAWLNSSSHRANMSDRAFSRVGIGIVLGADNVWYGTHVFAG